MTGAGQVIEATHVIEIIEDRPAVHDEVRQLTANWVEGCYDLYRSPGYADCAEVGELSPC